MKLAIWKKGYIYQPIGLKKVITEVKKCELYVTALQESKQLGSEIVEQDVIVRFKVRSYDTMLEMDFAVRRDFKKKHIKFNPTSD